MAKEKFYAVKKGKETGIFNNWKDCLESITGFTGAKYKSFISREEAEAYLNDEDIVMKNDIIPRLNGGRVVAFTDGSYDDVVKAYGSGVLIFLPDGSNKEISISGNDRDFVQERNIAGEVMAVLNAIDWALNNGYDKITIFYDLQNIGGWAKDNWKTNTNCSKTFKKYLVEKKNFIDIEFVKVKGHSNNIYNNKADELAKSAIHKK